MLFLSAAYITINKTKTKLNRFEEIKMKNFKKVLVLVFVYKNVDECMEEKQWTNKNKRSVMLFKI